MKTRWMIPLAVAALYGCAENTPTDPLPRVPNLRPLLGAFPGANGRITYAFGGIFTMNPDGSDVQQLTPDGAGPSWNAAGTKMLFYAAPVDGAATEIYVVNADGSGRTQITFNSVGRGLAFPSWSPDGTKILFQNDADGKIYVMNADGSNPVALTGSGADAIATWSPNGNQIAFTSWRDNGVAEIYVMNADGSSQTRLTNNLTPDFDPGWSPDGTKILFSREGGNPGDHSEIYVMNADGTNPTNLTNTPARADVSGVWSPDGSKIAFIGSDDAGADVFVMNADGTNQTNITNSPAREIHPDWQPLPSAPVCVFGPEVYTRGQGPPARIVETFSATPGSYSVDLDDLATSGADAVVTLNGVVIMDGRGTTGEVGPRHKIVTVTLLANNTLEIHLRGKKGSKLQVTICPAVSACYPDLEPPQLTLESATVEGSNVRFQLDVPNHAQIPAELFMQAPDLPACGLNTSASRTWVDIYDENDAHLFGFCSLGSPSDLNDIYFVEPADQRPAEAYIKVTDRRCNITYTSNRITIPAAQ